MAKNKILTIEDLIKFCKSNKMYNFSSKDTGKPIVVQSIQDFSSADIEESEDGKLYCKVRVCHTLLNRNRSFISEDSMKQAMPTLKYSPLLAMIHQLDDGSWDFHAHDSHVETDEEGNEYTVYDEQQIGTFTADEPYLEYDEEMDKTYVVARVAIPEEYTRAASIIRAKKGTKVSCELIVYDCSYNANENYLQLDNFRFNGCTCLGSEKDGTPIGEGMLGSKLTLEDFSEDNNSLVKFSNQLIEMQARLNELEARFNINDQNNGQNENQEEGGNKNMDKFNELLSKYGKTIEDVDFDYEGLTDEELDQKFESVFGEAQSDDGNDDDNADNVDNPEDNSSDDEPSDDEETPKIDEVEGESDETSDNEPEIKEDNACGGGSKKKKKCSEESMSRTYEISHDEIRYSLYQLLMPYEEAENDCYWIMDVFDTYFVYQSCTGKTFGQKYTKDNDVVAFDGERYELFLEYLTASEMAELKDMRSNYSSIVEQLNAYKYAEDIADKLSIFEDEGYSAYLDTDEFKNLMSEDTLKKFTKEELIEKADAALGKAVKEAKTYSFNFSNEDVYGKKKNKIGVFSDFDTAKDQNPYGDYFKSIN